ncbi:hypothetical protein AMECASPLE_035145 [Ameca splendens]|uniref:Uncharacterized protein n=1 Tax=Ameca splendens TaxID=208324 RepID=A0ABV0XWB1_9TELE
MFGPAKSVRLSPPPGDPTHHQVVISGQLSPSLHPSVQIMRPKIGEAIPPNHASPGVTVVSHEGIEVPQQNSGDPGRGTIQHPGQGRQEGRVLCTTACPVGRNDSQRPVPNPKMQGYDPLIHWGKPQHKTVSLPAGGGNAPLSCLPTANKQHKKKVVVLMGYKAVNHHYVCSNEGRLVSERKGVVSGYFCRERSRSFQAAGL